MQRKVDMEKLSSRIKEKRSSFPHEILPEFPCRNLLIEVTNACNHQCVFCANSKMRRRRGFIEPEIVGRVLEEAFALGTREVGFYAMGEPLLDKNLARYVRLAKNIGFDYTYMTTNGVFLDEGRCRELVEAGLDSIKFSINAGTRESYRKVHGRDDFDLVIQNVRQAAEYRAKTRAKVRLYVSSVRTRLSADDSDALRAAVGPYVDEVVFYPVYNQGGMMHEVNDSLMVSEPPKLKPPCPLPFNSLTVTCEGFVTACCVDFEANLVVADLHKTTLAEAWSSSQFKKLRQMHLQGDLGHTMCHNCLCNVDDAIEPLYAQGKDSK